MARPQTDGEERPRSLTWALRLLGVLVLFGGIVVVTMIVRHDDLIRAWAEGNPSARRILETEGIDALKDVPDGKTQPPAFITPAVTLFGTLALLVWVLGVFLRNGFEWARICITAVLLVIVVCGVGGLLTGPPPLFVAATFVGFLLAAVCVVLMWLPGSTHYIHPRAEEKVSRLKEDLHLPQR